MRLIQREKIEPAAGMAEGSTQTKVLGGWLWRRRGGEGGGHIRVLGGAFLYLWMKNWPTQDYASTRTWSLFDLVALVHVDDKGGTLKATTPGWRIRWASLAPRLNFKKVNLYGHW